jgi:hypothetical protein
MISRSLSQRLERLEARLGPTSGPRFLVIRIIAVETGEIVQRSLLPLGDDRRRRGRRTQHGRREAYEYD